MSILKTISIFVIGAAIVVGGVLFFENKNKIKQINTVEPIAQNRIVQENVLNKNPTTNTPITRSNTTLEDLLAQASYEPTMCKGSITNDQGAIITTVVYLYQKMIRGDSVVTFRGTTNKGSVIVKDSYIYAWQGNQGTKVALQGAISPSTINSFGSGVGLTNNPYECEPWTPNLGIFSIPTNVIFPSMGFMKVNPAMVNNPQFTEQDLDRMMQENSFGF